jgi:ABC-2 type transport system ATP-binding protein
VVSESPLTVRAYPRKNSSGDELARAIGDVVVRERWHLQELHAEEGRLDEVFRNITLPDTEAPREETK